MLELPPKNLPYATWRLLAGRAVSAHIRAAREDLAGAEAARAGEDYRLAVLRLEAAAEHIQKAAAHAHARWHLAQGPEAGDHDAT